MTVVGHGIDVVEVRDFSRLLEEPEGDFIERCFTSKERLSVADSPNAALRLAGKFAAKEAVAKALRTGFDGTLAPTDIEVLSLEGRPTVQLLGAAAAVAKSMCVREWLVSISHTSSIAVASAIAHA